ncbi:MAG: GspH/FimT family pseudopilin [Steroidobacteraceae bacterium]
MKSTQHGFTMVELIVVISIVGILMAVGTPSYRYFTTANRISSEINGLLGDMQFARAEAIREGQPVSLCASTDGATCSGVATWTTGWIVFSDSDAAGTIGTVDVATDRVLRVQTGLMGGDKLTADNTISAVTFSRDGFALQLPGTVTMALKDSTANVGYTRCLAITIVGALQTQIHGAGSCP